MPVKSLYFKNTAPTGAATSRALQDGGTAPATGITTTGWIVARLTAPNLSAMTAGTERASNTFTTADAIPTFAASACWRTENALTGTFANTNWTLAFRVRAVTAAAAQTGRIKLRIWRSANADGTGATQLTSAVQTGTTTAALSTTVSATSTVTWTPGGTMALAGEYLWVQCEWDIVVASTNNSGDVDFFIESAGVITTPNFTVSYSMPADEVDIVLAGQPAGLRVAHVESHLAGAIVLTGQAAVLKYGRAFPMPAAAGAVAVTGNAANLVATVSAKLIAAPGAVAVSLQPVALRCVRAMLAAPAGIVLAGADAELTYTPAAVAGAITMDAAAGAIVLTGNEALLTATAPPEPPITVPVGMLQFAIPRASRPYHW